ncbi:RHS repeat-associated core domain-containing protein [Actinacidiphila paucisporea]|uniref:RHS repeat-associated core domain-containing protein n=1 Tax=Actinacidiphila paucisporea TaxID=310782 RepID=UPI001F3EB3D4|nr:RHS repeat-associated core domain-containing protein [Actinacidiphila paucisporea]
MTSLGQTAADAAGIKGVLFQATAATPGAARLDVGYGRFASAFGGGWGSRLRLVQLPGCVLTRPRDAGCRTPAPLVSHNDLATQTLTADVSLTAAPGTTTARTAAAPMVFAAEASGSGGESPSGSGNYSATPMSASSTWAAGGSSGSFTWSYPLAVPAAAAGPAPSIGLSYDSGSVDGKTATTNNQATQLGEGFTLTSDAYITRTYGNCDDDGQDSKNDECWKYDNASLVLEGHSSELVKDDSAPDTWRLKDDDASTVTHSTGAANGDEGDSGSGMDGAGEYWTVTTGDGTKYVFGLNKLPGAGTERTNSVWTVPIFGDDAGEPGYGDGSSFSSRSLNQAWRWNLDYVVDVHGNAATYWYTPETNYYGKNGATTGTAAYVRAGHLDKILYGQRSDTLFTAKASDQVVFTYAERCFADDCSSLTKDTADHWPDVPFDAVCAKDADCRATAPAFFTRKRLTSIETSAWLAASNTYDGVDKWDFAEEFLDPGDIGDTSDQSLVLDSIVHTGEGGSDSIALKPVTFTYRPLANRVDATDDILPLSRYRIDTITSETGAITTVTLAPADCVRGSVMPAAEDNDDKACFPQYWHVNGSEDASLDWFQKYPVKAVVTTDSTKGFGEGVEHSYSYAQPGWAYNDDPFTPQDERTWSDFRGFGTVTETTGAGGTTQSRTVSLYMLGLDGDKRKDTSATRSATVTGIEFPSLTIPDLVDSRPYAGAKREQITYNGSSPVSVTVSEPWSKKTATQHKSYADIEAYYVRTAKTSTNTYLTVSQTWRTRTVSTTYDSYGMVATTDDSGDTAKSGDEACTRNWYARNAATAITSLVSRTRTVARPCSVADADLNLPATKATRGDVLSDTATVFDDTAATTWSPDQSPTKGEATWSGRPSGYPALASGGERNPSGWQTLVRTVYDDSTAAGLGRPVTMKDVQGHTSTTSYVPVAAGPTTQTTVTGPPTAASPNGQTIVTDFDPERGKTVKTTGVDGKVSEATYDALGRITATWLTNRRRILHQAANYVYAYHPDNTAPSWQSTGTLKADGTTYNTVYTFYDFLLRPLQTQSPTPNGGRLVTDTRYDTRGLAYETYADIFDPANTPSGIYARAEYGGAPKQTETVYDGAGRATTSTLLIFGVQQWSTTTSYTGDSTAVTGLDGGSAVRTITDALGRNTEERRYAGTSPADVQYGSGVGTAYTATKFTYTLDGGPSTVTSPDGAQWSYTYDLYGRQTKAVDPDAGTTTTGYTDLDQVSWTKDAEGRVVISAYDELGRLTGTWTAPAGADLTSTSEEQIPANQLTGRTYDTPVVGQPSSSTRYVGGSASGKAYTSKVTAYDSLNRATATELDLPAGDPLVTSGAVTSALAVSTAYNTDGTQQFVKTPAAGGLPSETVETRYNGFGLPTTLQGTSGYVNGTSYSPLGQVSQLDLATSAAAGIKHMFVTNTFQDGTDRLKLSKVTDQTHPYEIQELNYDYDDAGNVTHIFDPTTLGGTGKADNQCFGYDGYDRMTEAWTPAAADCSTANRTATSLGGASPYWTSYTYTDGGLRSTQTTHTAAGSTLATYCYNNASHPHGLTAVIPSAACAGAPTQYTYDATGNTQTRPKGTSTETLGWNAENRLASVKVPSGTTTDTTNYLYDADGTLLIRSDDSGETVLYLDGVTEVHLKKSGTTTYWAQRTYTLFGATVAVRTNQPGQPTLSWTAGDPHGTGSLAVTATGTDQVVTKRYTTPFGAPRTGGTGTWPDDKGFLGKPQDNTTGLTYIGARAYDTTTGRFISVDPLLDTSDGQSLNGYAYADNNPTTNSDPTGLLCVRGDCNAPGAGLNGGNGPAPGDDLYDENVDYCNKHDCDRDGDPNASNGPTKDIVGDPLPPLPANNRATFLRMYNLQLQVSIKYHMRPHMESQKWAAAMQGCIETDACTAGESRAYMWAFLVALAHEDPSIVMASARSMGGGFAEFSGFSVLGSEKDLSLFKGRFCSHSFVADTEVELADGQTKDIEDVEVGDKVVTTDPDTGKTAVRPVIATIITDHDKNFTDLTVKAGSTSASIVATDTHPFWVVNEGRWVDAGDLTPGMQLRDDAGQAVPVLAARHFVQQQRTYDLTIDDLHTYYVLAGQTPVLVHNDGGAGFDLNKLDRPGYSNYVLVDRNNVPYYSGMFGPNESPASVQRRHSGTWNRYDPANGDRMDVFPGTRTYGQSRLLEQRMTDHFGTYIGEDGTNYRGNRQNPMDSKKEPGYLAYERYKNGGCP